jgi:hypothetical protein
MLIVVGFLNGKGMQTSLPYVSQDTCKAAQVRAITELTAANFDKIGTGCYEIKLGEPT